MVPLFEGISSGYYLVIDSFGDLVVVSPFDDDFVLIFNQADGHHVISYPSLGDYYSSLF